MPNLLDKSTFLITGGTGSWGRELTRQVLERFSPKEIRIHSHGEHALYEMERTYAGDRLKFILGDVRDANSLKSAMEGVDFVFHLAALKHVPICEENCWEAVLTNVFGTQNVIEAAIECHVRMVIYVSSDKAVDPFSFYGLTKACAERLVVNADHYNASDTRFVCVRSGNILGTTGSVIPLFKEQIRSCNCITVTDPQMTRFFTSTRQAIGFVFQAIHEALGGEVFILKTPATTVGELAQAMISLLGNENTKIEIVGRRPGEKKHEVLISKNEVSFTRDLQNGCFVILPQLATAMHRNHYNRYCSVVFDELTSQNAERLDAESLERLIRGET